MTTHQLRVLNIKCGGCVNSIHNEMTKINGVTSVVVSKEDGIVIISGIALERDVLVAKLHEIGYPEYGHNSLISKAKALITCTFQKNS